MPQKPFTSRIASATGASAIGALATGALAIGAVALGALAIGRLRIGRAKLDRLEIGELVVDQLNVRNAGSMARNSAAPVQLDHVPALPETHRIAKRLTLWKSAEGGPIQIKTGDSSGDPVALNEADASRLVEILQTLIAKVG